MTVYERVQAQGEWDIKLREGTPVSLLAGFTPFNHIVILQGRAQPGTLNDTFVATAALYTGVLLKTPGRSLTLGGAGLGWWLGDGDSQGAVLEGAVTQTAASLSTWVTALRPGALVAGTVTSPGGTLTASYQWVTVREALDGVCSHFGVEWRVTPAFKLDVATAATLYGSTPTAITLPRGGGDDIVLPGIEGLVDVEREYDELSTRIIVSGPGWRAASGGAHASYRDGQGNLIVLYRLADSPSTPPGSEQTVADSLLNLWGSASQRSISVDARRYGITHYVPAGSTLYIYDPEFGLYDVTKQVQHQGVLTFPISVRVMGVRWPVEEGMGVYYRYWDSGTSAFKYADLTPYVEFESGTAKLEIN